MNYPRITRHDNGFGFNLILPEQYRKMIKMITPEIRKSVENKAIDIQNEFDLDDCNGDFPYLNWDDKGGLVGVVVGIGCPCVKIYETSILSYSFHNVQTPNQALELMNIISYYLNGLQNLK